MSDQLELPNKLNSDAAGDANSLRAVLHTSRWVQQPLQQRCTGAAVPLGGS